MDSKAGSGWAEPGGPWWSVCSLFQETSRSWRVSWWVRVGQDVNIPPLSGEGIANRILERGLSSADNNGGLLDRRCL